MSERLDVEIVKAAIRKRLAELGDEDDDWRALEDVIETEIEPLLPLLGAESIIEKLAVSKADPLIAGVLVQLSGGEPGCFSRDGEELVFRVDDLFTDEEILGAALDYVTRIYDGTATLFTGDWGWMAIGNGWGQLSDDATHLRLVRELIRLAPDDDRVLWSIGVGPVATLLWGRSPQSQEAHALMALARDDPKVARVLALIDEGLPYPYPAE
jgi:hypothetical protein